MPQVNIGFNPQDRFMMAVGNTLVVVTQEGSVFGADVVGRDVGAVFQVNPPLPTIPDVFGAYFWAGYDVPNALVPGLQILQQAGFRSTARIRLVPDSTEYRFDEQWEREVPSTVPFLPAAVRSTQYQRAFSLPGLRTFVFTAYDSASAGHLFDSDWLDLNAEMVRSEYRDMTVALYETQNGTGKQFIVCNWETDNSIYFDQEAPSYASAPKQLQALRRWFQLRQEGIRQGREIALQNGWGGIEVNDAIEFNTFYHRREYQTCFPNSFVGDTLSSIIKDIKPDYASFSAWESTGRCRLYDDLMTIKGFLHTATNGHTRLIVGELGVTGHASPNVPTVHESVQSKAWRYIKLAHAAVRADIPVIILWKAWDYFGQSELTEGEGLLNGDGTERQVLRDLRASFGSTLKIAGVVDQFDMYGWRAADETRGFELYGSFPEANPGNVTEAGWVGNYSAIVEFSDGEMVATDTAGESESQINLSLRPDDHKVRWFMLRVRRKRDGFMSPEFGPVRLNRIPPESSNCEVQVNQRYWDYWD